MSFIGYIKGRLHKQNRNFLCAIVGPTGSGKSYCALRLAQQIDKDFSISQVVFTPSEFLDLLNSGKLKRGSAIVFDEAGVAANSRNFQTATNKLLHYINQTFRSNNYAVIYTVPDFNFLDKGIRKLVHTLIETKRIDYERNLCWVKPLMIENNPQSGKIYMKYPRYRNLQFPRQKTVITKMYFHKPDEELITAYEARKLAFNKSLQAQAQTSIHAGTQQGKPKPDLQVLAQKIKDNPTRYRTKEGGLHRANITQDFGIGDVYLRRLRDIIKG